MDPQIREFVTRMSAAFAAHPSFSLAAPAEARVSPNKCAPWRAGGPTMLSTTEHQVPAGTGSVRIRVYDRARAAPRPRSSICTAAGGRSSVSIRTIE